MTVFVTWGHSQPLRCNVQEIIPEGDHLCFQNQYRLNSVEKYDLVRVPSLPLGMVFRSVEGCPQKLERSLGIMLMSNEEWRKILHNYLDSVLEHDFDDFPENCFHGTENQVQRDFLHSFFNYYQSIPPANVGIPHSRWGCILIKIHARTHELYPKLC